MIELAAFTIITVAFYELRVRLNGVRASERYLESIDWPEEIQWRKPNNDL
jgi:hypothetical protein